MRVCFLTGEYPPMPGGVGDYTRELSLAMRALDVEVDVITSRRASAAPDAESAASGPRIFPIMDDWGYRGWGQIAGVLDECNPDVVHIQYQTAAFGMHPAINLLPLFLRRRKSRPAVAVTFHDLKVPYLFPKAGPVRRLPAIILAWASDLVVVTNQEDALIVMDRSYRDSADPGQLRSRYAQRPLHLIPIGSNIATAPPIGYDRQDWRCRMGVDDDYTLLAYFGFLGHSKGVDLLFEAFRDLLQQKNKFKLVMIGGMEGASDPTNRAYARQMRALADEPALRDQVIWTGFVTSSEVSAYLLASDIGVLPFREGASLRHGTLVATIVHGLPTITTLPPASNSGADQPCLPESLRLNHRHNVYLVQTNDAVALRNAIMDLVSDTGLTETIRQGAHRMAPSFAWDSIARQTLAAYNGIL